MCCLPTWEKSCASPTKIKLVSLADLNVCEKKKNESRFRCAVVIQLLRNFHGISRLSSQGEMFSPSIDCNCWLMTWLSRHGRVNLNIICHIVPNVGCRTLGRVNGRNFFHGLCNDRFYDLINDRHNFTSQRFVDSIFRLLSFRVLFSYCSVNCSHDSNLDPIRHVKFLVYVRQHAEAFRLS